MRLMPASASAYAAPGKFRCTPDLTNPGKGDRRWSARGAYGAEATSWDLVGSGPVSDGIRPAPLAGNPVGDDAGSKPSTGSSNRHLRAPDTIHPASLRRHPGRARKLGVPISGAHTAAPCSASFAL